MLKKVILSLILAILLLVPLAACKAPAPSEEAPPIKFGGPLSLGDITGDQQRKGALLAEKEINEAGGILGRPLKVLVIDDEMKPEKGAAALEKLATVDNVDVFIGGMSSSVHMAQIPILRKYEKVTVWMGAASSKCEEAVGPADWYFHIHPWDYMQVMAQARGWKEICEKHAEVKVHNMFIAYEEGAFGAAMFAAGGALYKDWADVMGESFKSAALGGGDYTAVLQHAKDVNPDLFIWVGYEADAFPIMEQTKAIGFAPPLFVGTPPGWPVGFAKSPLAHGVSFYSLWITTISEVSKASKNFYDAYIEMWGEEPVNYCAPLGYTNVYITAQAVKRAGTLEKEALIKALEKTEYDSPFGVTITFKPSKICKHQGIDFVSVCQCQNGKEELIWPFEISTAKLLYPFPSWEGR